MTRSIILSTAVTVAAIAAALAADLPGGTSSGTQAGGRAADTCRPQPLCRAYVNEGDQLLPAPPPGSLVLRGPGNAEGPGASADDDTRRLPALPSSESAK
jgi:hypothetical protein